MKPLQLYFGDEDEAMNMLLLSSCTSETACGQLKVGDEDAFRVARLRVNGQVDLRLSPVTQNKLVGVLETLIQTGTWALENDKRGRRGSSRNGPVARSGGFSGSMYWGNRRGYAGAILDSGDLRTSLPRQLMRLYASVQQIEGMAATEYIGYFKFRWVLWVARRASYLQRLVVFGGIDRRAHARTQKHVETLSISQRFSAWLLFVAVGENRRENVFTHRGLQASANVTAVAIHTAFLEILCLIHQDVLRSRCRAVVPFSERGFRVSFLIFFLRKHNKLK